MEALERFATWLKLDGELLPYGVLFTLFAVLIAIETVHPAFEQSPERQRRWPANIVLGLLNVFLPPWLPISIFWAAEWAHDTQVGLLNAVSWPGWASTLWSVIPLSLADYVIHVLMHKVPYGLSLNPCPSGSKMKAAGMGMPQLSWPPVHV